LNNNLQVFKISHKKLLFLLIHFNIKITSLASVLPLTKNNSHKKKHMSTIKTLEKMLGYCTQKQKIVSKNIANIGTKNYQRQDVQFKELLNDNYHELRVTNRKHFGFPNENGPVDEKFEIITDTSTDKISGENNVDIDTEMAEMAENTLKFKFASKKAGDYYRNLQNVIKTAGPH